jgi:hypothetical protein
VLGIGGDEHLARAVIATRLGEVMEADGPLPEEPFWISVLHFFVNNPMLDTACVGPIVDYVHHRRTAPREAVGGGDGDTPVDPEARGGAAPSEFTMKGRTVPALLLLVEEWHRQLARESRKPPLEWEGAPGIQPLYFLEGEGAEQRCWRILELRTSRALRDEGKAMSHCVASYARSCARGHTSVWSMQVEECRTGICRRVMTIAVHNARRAVTQARGRCNRMPGAKGATVRLNDAPAILQQWAKQESLLLTKHV